MRKIKAKDLCFCSCGQCGPALNLHDCGRAACRNENTPIPEEECMCHVLPFDEEQAHKMSASEVRKKFPRFDGRCASCDYSGIVYSSFAHYIYGDW